MRNKIILLFSHTLTDNQIIELEKRFEIEKITYLADELQFKWSNLSPDYTLIEEELKNVKSFIKNNIEEGFDKQYILIQGEYGAVYHMVNFAFSIGLIPIYSASKRAYESRKIDGNKIENIHYYEHVRFQLY